MDLYVHLSDDDRGEVAREMDKALGEDEGSVIELRPDAADARSAGRGD